MIDVHANLLHELFMIIMEIQYVFPQGKKNGLILKSNKFRQCSAGNLNLKYLCSDYTENYMFIDCMNGHCQCLPGFRGSATINDKCRCSNVQWQPSGPVCLD